MTNTPYDDVDATYAASTSSSTHTPFTRRRRNHSETREAASNDSVHTAQVDDTRARVLLAEGRVAEAEKLVRSAVRILEGGGQQSLLAEALTTHGLTLARLGRHKLARLTLQRAMEVAQNAGKGRQRHCVHAAELLGIRRQSLDSMLHKGRHKELAHLRTPTEPRKSSLMFRDEAAACRANGKGAAYLFTTKPRGVWQIRGANHRLPCCPACR